MDEEKERRVCWEKRGGVRDLSHGRVGGADSRDNPESVVHARRFASGGGVEPVEEQRKAGTRGEEGATWG